LDEHERVWSLGLQITEPSAAQRDLSANSRDLAKRTQCCPKPLVSASYGELRARI
jgi:hypothetical protein